MVVVALKRAFVASGVPVSKRERIVFLLEHWVEIFDPDATSVRGGLGGGVALMPLMSRHPSVVELERCLRVLRGEAPRQHDHLKAFYTAEWRIRVGSVRRRRPGGRWESREVRVRERVVPSWVRAEKVRRGEERLVLLFRGEVFVPGELWDALTKPAAA